MKRFTLIRRTAPIFLVLLIVGCVHLHSGEDYRMEKLAGQLVMLTADVQGTVRYDNPPTDISDQDLLILATKQDPKLLEEFKDYKVSIKRQDRNVIVLVCTKDGKKALLEDAGCTPEVDKKYGDENHPQPCEFTLSNLCNKN